MLSWLNISIFPLPLVLGQCVYKVCIIIQSGESLPSSFYIENAVKLYIAHFLGKV